MKNRRGWMQRVLAVAVMAGCGTGSETRPGGSTEVASSAPTGEARQALTGGAGSVGSCAGNPARCTAVMLAGGDRHTVALKGDGRVWTWGENGFGQLGDDAAAGRSTPGAAAGTLSGIVAVAAGSFHSVALTADGSVWGWGSNGFGQLGDGTKSNSPTPVQVKDAAGTGRLTGVVAVAAGSNHTVAVTSDGAVWAWGLNDVGELGAVTPVAQVSPVRSATSLVDVVAVAAGDKHTVALRSDGNVSAWGGNDKGQLGNRATSSSSIPPVAVEIPSAVAVAAGAYHNVALASDGSVWTWGAASAGQLGDGTAPNTRATPQRVKNAASTGTLTGIVAVAAGSYHSVALASDGTVWTWGQNGYGQLGDDTTSSRSLPVQVKDAAGTGTLGGVVAVAARSNQTLALTSDGAVWAWGENGSGQLGDGTTTERHTPVRVGGLSLAAACRRLPTCDADGASATFGACVARPVPDGTSCGTGKVCAGGSCADDCFISDTLYAAGAADPSNPCRVCEPATSTTSWSHVADGTACDDGDACTQTDMCQGGTCTGSSAVVCTALDACRLPGTCDTATGECSSPPMPDGATCNGTYVCSAGLCPSTCASDSGCAAGAFCDEGACRAKRVQGATCTTSAACATGFCVDGVCCESACDGKCQSCGEAGHEGTCVSCTVDGGADADVDGGGDADAPDGARADASPDAAEEHAAEPGPDAPVTDGAEDPRACACRAAGGGGATHDAPAMVVALAGSALVIARRRRRAV